MAPIAVHKRWRQLQCPADEQNCLRLQPMQLNQEWGLWSGFSLRTSEDCRCLRSAVWLFVGKANGSSDRLVADMDDRNREVEQGIALALCQSLPLLNVVIRDAATQTTSPVWYYSMLCVFRLGFLGSVHC